jgi:hypothetical protein
MYGFGSARPPSRVHAWLVVCATEQPTDNTSRPSFVVVALPLAGLWLCKRGSEHHEQKVG